MTETDPASVRRRVGGLRDRLGESPDQAPAVRAAVAELEAVAAQLEAEAQRLDEAAADLRDERLRIDQARDASVLFEAIPAACLVTDRKGIVRQSNLAAADLFSDAGLVGKPLVPRFASADRARVTAQVTAGGRGGMVAPSIVTLEQVRRVVRVELRCASAGDDRLLWLARDVTEQEAAHDRLREAVEHERTAAAELRQLDEVRNAFILAVSHDLQSPLAAIAGLAGLVIEQPRMAAADRRRIIDQVRTTAERLLVELRGLLDLERLHRGDIGLEPRSVDLDRLLRSAADVVDLGERRLEIDAKPSVAVIDPLIVERIVHNLLANAARHTPPQTTVWTRCRRNPDAISLVVEDDGPGIPDELRDRVFELFSRDRRSTGGLGVGLALVRRFAELHGGSARVEARRGGGASFQVLLAELSLPEGVA